MADLRGERVRAYVLVEVKTPRKKLLVFAVPLVGTPDDPQEISLGIGASERVVGVFVAPEPADVPDELPEP